MLPVTLNGESCYLLHYRPDWKLGFAQSAALPCTIDLSKGGRGAREPDSATLRNSLKFSMVLRGRNKSVFTIALQRYAGEHVLCPYWPALHRYFTGDTVYTTDSGDVYVDSSGNPYTASGVTTPIISSGLWLLFEENWSAWAILQGDEEPSFTPSATAVRVPLLVGYLSQLPHPPASTDERITVPVDFIEDSPASLALVPTLIAPAEGPALSWGTPMVLDGLVNWTARPNAGGVRIDIERQQLGRGRQLAQAHFPQEAARRLEATFLCRDWLKLSALLSFFLARKGQSEVFWVPGLLSECRLVSPATSSSAVVSVDDVSLLGDNRYIAFVRPGQPAICRHVVSINTGANTLTLDSSPGDLAVGSVNLVSLILVRFVKPSIDLNFQTDARASARLEFLEVPAEYANPAGEVIGQSMGSLPERPYLYRFIRRYPGETVVDAMTDWESDLLADGLLHRTRGIEHDAISDSTDPDLSLVTLQLRHFPGNPLWLVIANALEIPLELEIYRCTADREGHALSPELWFSGQLKKRSTKTRGPFITASFEHKLAILQQKVPVPVMQPECNWEFCSESCALSFANFTWSAVVVAISDASVTLGTFVRTNGGASIVFGEDWFSFGRLWCGSRAADYAQRTIYSSSAIASGQVTVQLSRGFLTPPAVGSTVYLQPGCNGTLEWCRTKYNNYDNFGGLPYMPTGNRSFVFNRSTPNPTAAKK